MNNVSRLLLLPMYNSPIQRPLFVSIRLKSSTNAICAVEHNDIASIDTTKYPIQLQDELPNECTTNSTDRIGKDEFKPGKEGHVYSERYNRPKWYSGMLGVSVSNRSLNEGKAIHGHIIKNGINPDQHLWNSLVNFYANCGSYQCARHVLDEMPDRDVVPWTSLIAGFVANGYTSGGINVFSEMQKEGIKPHTHTFSSCLKACSACFDLDLGRQLHAMINKVGCDHDAYVSCSLLDMYSKCRLVDDALKVFKRIKDPNIVIWGATINCLDKQGRSQEAAELFCLMQRVGKKANQFIVSSLINAATNLGNLHYAESIHACVYKYGFESDTFISNSLAKFYMEIGSFEKAWKVFDSISVRDIASWNIILSGLHESKSCEQGPQIFCRILMEGFKLDIYTLVSILDCCSSLEAISFGKQVHTHVVKNGLVDNCSVGTALTDMYVRSGSLEDAEAVFSRLQERDTLTWTVIIGAYARNDQAEKAFSSFNRMREENMGPNEFTLSSCLTGYSGLSSLEIGRQLHSLAIKAGMSKSKYVNTALLNMYSKCRCIEDAETVFWDMTERNTISWNAIICGYSHHGNSKKALEAFRLMLEESMIPDEITFIGVLSACSHLGLIEEGKKHFNSMKKIYKISPIVEHHACMVNIFCRAGKFSEADRYIEDMNLTQNVFLWETFLWGSKIHGNIEFGQKSLDNLLSLGHKMDYNYILVSNLLAANGMWDEVLKVRELLCSHGIKKDPACSWIEIDGGAHMFFPQDGSQPEVKDVCRQLGVLTQL